MNAPVELRQAVVVGDELALAWSDDAESYLKLERLRRACPCAHCQGEPDALGRVFRPAVTHGPNAFLLQRFESVGGYALQFFWGDSHHSGIYSFNYLRQLAAPELS
jgi:DUF971 family protein